MSQSAAWYALRRTLPPWAFDENLAELVSLAPKWGVDEIVLKVDTEEFTHGQPRLDWLYGYLPKLEEAKRRIEEAGMVFSLNPWITVGHCDRGRDGKLYQADGCVLDETIMNMVGHDGRETRCCACPLCPVWRKHFKKVWSIYSSLRPRVMWVEDDLRTFNHEPIEYGCFCDRHMQLFSERVGEKVTRERLIEAIIKPGEVHPWRAEYLDMQGEQMAKVAGFIGDIVRYVSPQTRMGLMSSGPRQHALEGRRWHDLAAAMGGGEVVYSRPPMDNYFESSLRGFYYSHDSIKLTRHVLPKDTIEQTEIESVPFTRYSKSVAATFVELAISFAYGSHGVTLNLFDHMGTPMADEVHFGEVLADKKPFLELLASEMQKPGRYRGVRNLFSEKSSYDKLLGESDETWGRFGGGGKAGGYAALRGDGFSAMSALEATGIPTVYEDDPTSSHQVTLATGQTVRSLTDNAIKNLLKTSVFLDGEAVGVLYERGFAKHLGITECHGPICANEIGPVSAEEFHHPQFGGHDKKMMTMTLPFLFGRPRIAVMETVSDAQIISYFVDSDTVRKHIGMYAFENHHGGRVIVHALDWEHSLGISFHSPARTAQLQHAFKWLSCDQIPLVANPQGAYPLTFRKDFDDGTSVIGLFNLTLDSYPSVVFDVADARGIEKISVLLPDGQWANRTDNCDIRRKSDESNHKIEIACDEMICYDTPLILKVSWALAR
ncbi:hypothetical protein [Poriferisphaera sp. WC338]|uniref:hypothetical protein n=1 Tax=Poriferisphaera sp. WC338 TaxID=3425129 RepID=UPI003D8195DC